MKYKIIVIIALLFSMGNVFASQLIIDNTFDNISNQLDLSSMLDVLDDYTNNEFDTSSLVSSLIKGEQLDVLEYKDDIVSNIFKEITRSVKSSITIVIVIIVCAILSALSLNEKSEVVKIANLVCFLVISALVISEYVQIIGAFVKTVNVLCGIVQVISPVLMTLLIATGAITTTSIMTPLLLLMSSVIGLVVTYIVIPMLSLSLVFNMISNMGEIKIEKISKGLSKYAFAILTILLTVFLTITQLQSIVTVSVDELVIKTAQAAVSNVIPVVGKFASDSVEVVWGATAVIGKAIGVVGVIVIVVVVLKPIVQIGIYALLMGLISALAEMLNATSGVVKLLEGFKDNIKTVFGMLCAVSIIYIISIATIISLVGKIVS